MDTFECQAFFLTNISPVPEYSPPEFLTTMLATKGLSRAHTVPANGMSSSGHSPDLSPITSPMDFLSSTPTSITRVLTYASPAIHLFSKFLELVSWETENISESCLLVAAWWALCLFTKELIVYGTHIFLVLWIIWRWIEKEKRERLGKPSSITGSVSQLDLDKTIQEIEKMSSKLSDFNSVVKKIDSHLDWSNSTQTQIVVLGLFYSYPVWVVFNYFVSLSWTLLVVGTLALVWNSPLFRVIPYALMESPSFRGIVRFIIGFVWSGRLKQEGKGFSMSIRKAKEQQRVKGHSKTTSDLVFRFELYENQRWWLGLDWTTNLFPNERPAWSDQYNEQTSNKNSFQLPPSTTTVIPSPSDSNILIQKTEEWRWVDSDWWIDLDCDVDSEGWEYADNRWKKFSSKGGFGRYTRRRKWVRTAKLVETTEKIQNPEAEAESSATNTDNTLATDSNTISKPLPIITQNAEGKFDLGSVEGYSSSPVSSLPSSSLSSTSK